MRAEVSQSTYTSGLKEDRAHIVDGTHEYLSVSWCRVLEV
jgi:hypothetical protein